MKFTESSRRCLYLVWILIGGWRLNDDAITFSGQKPMLDNCIKRDRIAHSALTVLQHCGNNEPWKLKPALGSRPDCYQCCYHLGCNKRSSPYLYCLSYVVSPSHKLNVCAMDKARMVGTFLNKFRIAFRIILRGPVHHRLAESWKQPGLGFSFMASEKALHQYTIDELD